MLKHLIVIHAPQQSLKLLTGATNSLVMANTNINVCWRYGERYAVSKLNREAAHLFLHKFGESHSNHFCCQWPLFSVRVFIDITHIVLLNIILACH